MLSQLLAVFGIASVVLVALYWINRAVSLFDWLIASGQSAVVFLEFTALTLPNIIRLVVPVAGFAAAIFVTNRLSSESELVVMQSTGFSPGRLARPVVIFGLLVGLFVSTLVHFIVPFSLTRLADREADISDDVTARLLIPGQFIHPSDGVTFYVRSVSPDGVLADLFLNDRREGTRRVTYTASEAKLVRTDNGPRLVMFDGMIQALDATTQQVSITHFDDLTFDISAALEGLRTTSREQRDRRERWTHELMAPTPEVLATTGATAERMWVEAHRRFTQGIFAVAAPLIGFATLLLGGFSRFGVWQWILLAIIIWLLTQTLDGVFLDIALDNIRLWPVLYVPPLIALITGAVLLQLAAMPWLFKRRDRSAT